MHCRFHAVAGHLNDREKDRRQQHRHRRNNNQRGNRAAQNTPQLLAVYQTFTLRRDLLRLQLLRCCLLFGHFIDDIHKLPPAHMPEVFFGHVLTS